SWAGTTCIRPASEATLSRSSRTWPGSTSASLRIKSGRSAGWRTPSSCQATSPMKGIALAGRQRDENDHGTRCVAASQGDDHRAVAVYVVARREAEIRRAAEFVLVDLVALGNGPEHFAVASLCRVSQFAGIGPDGHLELVEATHVVPVGVRDQHAAQPAAVVVAGVELLADSAGRLVGRAREPGLRLDVGRDAGPEARIDQEITPWVGNQD